MNSSAISLYELLKTHAKDFHKIVDFDETKDNLVLLDLSDKNIELQQIDITDTKRFSAYILTSSF